MLPPDLVPHAREHVEKLVRLGTSCPDEDRRLDAIKSLALMALLKGDDGDEPNPGDEVPEEDEVPWADFTRMAA